MRLVTFCLLKRNNQILLAMKKRGFGAGKWNGPGGKVLDGETIESAAVRELKEEIGVVSNLNDLENSGVTDFYFTDKPEWNQQMHIFSVKNWTGEPQESEEMKPEWFDYNMIPYNAMWSADSFWVPKAITGRKIQGEFYYCAENGKIEKFNIKEI